MNKGEKISADFIEEAVTLLELLTVSLDRLKGSPGEVVGFLESRRVLDQLARLRTKAWHQAEQTLDQKALQDLERRLDDLPFWTTR